VPLGDSKNLSNLEGPKRRGGSAEEKKVSPIRGKEFLGRGNRRGEKGEIYLPLYKRKEASDCK